MGGRNPFPTLTAEAAAELIPHGATVAFSGFTPAGAAKAVPRALAARARSLHAADQPFQVRVLTGASTGASVDDALAEADAVSWRAPYQSSAPLRQRINDGRVAFVDMHLSHLPRAVLSGFLGRVDVAVVEATEVTADGRVFLTTSVGASPTFLQAAGKVLIELNRCHSRRASAMADILVPGRPPYRPGFDLGHPLQRIGTSYARVDPGKVVGVVETFQPDELGGFAPPDPASRAIAGHVVRFLLEERAAGRIPPEFLPLQSGVGNIANAVLGGLGADPDVPNFLMYSEVLQAAAFELMRRGRLLGASTCALTLRPEQMIELIGGLEFFAPRLVLRPQEISNSPAVLRQLGVIALNTALEVDLYGHVNSTHVAGGSMVNGVGGSGDFARNAYLSVFMCPSTAKGGKISTVVPMCTHVDHNEHSVQVVVTEQGLADLRGLAPAERARRVIDRCAHPAYRDYLHRYVRQAGPGHIRHDLARCFELHQNLSRYGAMLPELAGGQAAASPEVPEPVAFVLEPGREPARAPAAGPTPALGGRALPAPADQPAGPRPRPAIRPSPNHDAAPFLLWDGTEVTVRALRPEDEPLIVALHARHSPHTIRMRFFGMVKVLSPESLTQLCRLDYGREMALVAERREGDEVRLLGVSRYHLDPAAGAAEFALVVEDAYQGKGLGRHLLERLIAVARERGVKALVGLVLAENLPMLSLARALGFGPPRAGEDGVVRVEKTLAEEDAHSLARPPVPERVPLRGEKGNGPLARKTNVAQGM
jgi:succinate CoA transferase